MKRNHKIALLLASCVAVSVSSSLLAVEVKKNINEQAMGQSSGFIRAAARPGALDTDFSVAAENSINSVVSIKSFAAARQQSASDMWGMDPFEFFFGPGNGQNQRRRQETPQNDGSSKNDNMQQLGLGSGVIISTDGYIVTNNHVIKGADRLDVTLNDNRKFNAKVIGADADADLALLKMEAKDLAAIAFGNSDDIKVGEWVLAVGNPFGLTSTVTAGIVSAKARGLTLGQDNRSRTLNIESFIQTDAAVNPGNSGGALVNTRGELVGINTLIYSETGSYAGYSFAIPSSIVLKIVEDLKTYGSVQRAVLGLSYTELTADLAKEKNITAVTEGLYVANVLDRSSAKEAGLQEGDVIVKINGKDVKNSGLLKEVMGKLRPGDKADITYYRNNKMHSVSVVLKNNQGNNEITKLTGMTTALGCSFNEVSDETKQQLQISNGVEVVGLKAGKLQRAGMKEGFIITEINGQSVNSREDVEEIYNDLLKSQTSRKIMTIIGLYPTGAEDYFAINIAK